jgi:membrane fusion protein (multidrug efflux system)
MSTPIMMDRPAGDGASHASKGAPATVPAAPVARQPRRTSLLVVVGVVLAVSGWGVKRYLYSLHHVTSDNAQVDGHITAIAPKVQAFVSRVLVDDNQPVRAGDTLIVLDGRDFDAKLQQADADYRNALSQAGSQGRAGQFTALLEAAEAQAASSSAAVAAAESNQKKAAADLQRYLGLADQRIISAQQLDAAQAAFDAATANLDAAHKQASAAASQVAASEAGLRGADARLAAMRAAVENAGLQVGYTVITAPVSGVVARRNAEVGALVQVGQTLMAIVPDRDIWVKANLKETQLTDLRLGDPVSFTVDAYPGRTFNGHVESVSPATGATFAMLPPDNATGNFTKVVQRVPVRIAIDSRGDPQHPLRPGMSVDVDISTH